MQIRRAWRLVRELWDNQGHKVVAVAGGAVAPERARFLAEQIEAGDFSVAQSVTGDVEDEDRNVVTDPLNTYRVVTDGLDTFLIEL